MDQNNIIGDLALVKDTGKIYKIENYFMTFKIQIIFDQKYKNILDKFFKELKDDSDSCPTLENDFKKLPEGKELELTTILNSQIEHYTLSDGNNYKDNEVIVGKDKIRNSHLEKLLENGIQ